jgi:protein phosphatase
MERLGLPGKIRVLGESFTEPKFVALPAGDLAYYTCSRPCSNRPNQDGIGVRIFESGTTLLAVADGLGGHANGQEAAKIAIERLLRFRIKSARQRVSEQILRKIELAHDWICSLPGGGGTTLVAAEITDSYLRFFNVGDSIGMYCLDKGSVHYKTFEHSVTGLAVESGIMKTQEALDHNQSHVILNALGFQDTRIEMSLPLKRHSKEVILLASDGLTGNLTIDEVSGILSQGSLQDQIHSLVDRTKARMTSESGSPDDLTIVLFHRQQN